MHGNGVYRVGRNREKEGRSDGTGACSLNAFHIFIKVRAYMNIYVFNKSIKLSN